MRTYLIDVGQNGRIELLDDIAHPDMVDEANRAFGGPPGRAGLVQHVVGFRKNVQDVSIDIERIVAGEGEVMAWWTFAGIHAGPWLGRPPTGKPLTGTVFSFFELKDGLITRYKLWLHANFDDPVVFDSSAAAAKRITA